MIDSKYKIINTVTFPKFTGLRIMHMPYHTHGLNSLSGIAEQYIPLLQALWPHTPGGVGYLTIDECALKKGEIHRRPGLHVDGVDETGPNVSVGTYGGGWGGGGGGGGGWGGGYRSPEQIRAGYGATGMIVAASHLGSVAYPQQFTDEPKANGDCEHLRKQCKHPSPLLPNIAFGLEPMTVHESIAVREDCDRQFIRISFPSNAAWYEGYTVNPNGVKPQGEIRPARKQFMDYRPDWKGMNKIGMGIYEDAMKIKKQGRTQSDTFEDGYLAALGWRWEPKKGWYKP